MNKFFWQSSPAGVSPGLLALDLGCAPSYITLPSAFASLRPGVERKHICQVHSSSLEACDRASGDGWTEGAVGSPQPRSRASSPRGTPAGADCQIGFLKH